VKTHTFVGDRPSNITNVKKIARTGGFLTTSFDDAVGAAYTLLEPDDECDEANLATALLHPWKGSSGGKTGGDAGRGVTHGAVSCCCHGETGKEEQWVSAMGDDWKNLGAIVGLGSPGR
jgi:hypothetical protein